MKKTLFALGFVFMLGVYANAQESSFSLRLGFPYLFSVGYEYDFENTQQGLGVRGFVGATYLFGTGLFGFGIEGLYRLPLGFLNSSVHAGLGFGGGYLISNGSTSAIPPLLPTTTSTGFVGYIYGHFGIEFLLTRGLGLVIDSQPVGFTFPNGFYLIPVFSLGLRFS